MEVVLLRALSALRIQLLEVDGPSVALRSMVEAIEAAVLVAGSELLSDM
jgi:hypothetical protein